MATGPDRPITLTVWSDFVCPFCYLELPVLDALKAEMGDGVRIDWRAYELRPAPEPTLPPDGEYLHRVWADSVYPMAKARGLGLKLPPVQPYSRKAHEAAEYSRAGGRSDEMRRAIFEAFFRDGRDIGDLAVLADIATAVGIDEPELLIALADDRYTDKVLADQRLAARIGVSGVPGMLITDDEKGLLISGAQPIKALRRAIVQLRAQ
jgi:predicted DsbA family dithiol-disulfide isomerase